jgi:hypothetical protein
MSLHPAITRAIGRHREFFAGTRQYLVKIHVPVRTEPVAAPAYDGLDWARDFDAYVAGGVENGVRQARARLALDLDDDTIPAYFPYFGIAIHHAFFGGEVTFSHGTSYAAPIIDRAAQWPELRPTTENPWMQRLARGLAYARDHGEGVLLASFRGGNGPLDMAGGVLGNALYTEMYDDPESVARLLDVCTDAIRLTFDWQRQHCSIVDGGGVCPMGGLWLPAPAVGHVSLDAACLAGPAAYDEFERPWMERLPAAVIHTHTLGRRAFEAMCRTRGFLVFAPANDPNCPTVLDDLDGILADIGDVPLMLDLPTDQLPDLLPKFHGRRAVFTLSAPDVDTARRVLDAVDRYCPLER